MSAYTSDPLAMPRAILVTHPSARASSEDCLYYVDCLSSGNKGKSPKLFPMDFYQNILIQYPVP